MNSIINICDSAKYGIGRKLYIITKLSHIYNHMVYNTENQKEIKSGSQLSKHSYYKILLNLQMKKITWSVFSMSMAFSTNLNSKKLFGKNILAYFSSYGLQITSLQNTLTCQPTLSLGWTLGLGQY